MNKVFDNLSKVACLDVHSPLYLKTGGSFGGGDISDLYKLVEKASQAGFSLLQFTPIQDTGNHEPCPYMGLSIFSFNPVFLSVEKLPWLPNFFKLQKDFEKELFKKQSEMVPYSKIYNFKMAILRESFKNQNNSELEIEDVPEQVLAYAVFVVLKNKFKTPWPKWPEEFRHGNSKLILKEHSELIPEVQFILFCQSILKKQWQDLEKYAQNKGIELIFDKPIYPVHDSAEVWANQDLFYTNNDGSLKFVSGVNIPGDPFGPQKWGHAVYQFHEKSEKVINYFVESIKHIASVSKVIRLDHTLALIWKYYIVKPEAEKGKYLPGLRDRLFSRLKKEFPHVYFIAEDLGFVSEKLIDKPLKKIGIPGMRCIQWLNNHRYLDTDKYPKTSVAITSNHDMLSLPAWWKQLGDSDKEIILNKLNITHSKQPILDVIRLVFRSPAKIASVTLRDIVGDFRRYNLPGVQNETNWLLQCPISLEDIDFEPIAKIVKETNR